MSARITRSRAVALMPVAIALILVAGCRAPAQQAAAATGTEALALLVAPTTEGRAELHQLISTALNGAGVTLAPDAFTQESHLAIERGRMNDPAGLPAQGRDPGRPEHFKLVTQDSRCILVHENSGRRWPLTQATCKPAG